MTERARETSDELVLYEDQRTLLRVTKPIRLLGAAHGGVHVLSGGSSTSPGSSASVSSSTPAGFATPPATFASFPRLQPVASST